MQFAPHALAQDERSTTSSIRGLEPSIHLELRLRLPQLHCHTMLVFGIPNAVGPADRLLGRAGLSRQGGFQAASAQAPPLFPTPILGTTDAALCLRINEPAGPTGTGRALGIPRRPRGARDASFPSRIPVFPLRTSSTRIDRIAGSLRRRELLWLDRLLAGTSELLIALQRAADHPARPVDRRVWIFKGTGHLLRACCPCEQHDQTEEKKTTSQHFRTLGPDISSVQLVTGAPLDLHGSSLDQQLGADLMARRIDQSSFPCRSRNPTTSKSTSQRPESEEGAFGRTAGVGGSGSFTGTSGFWARLSIVAGAAGPLSSKFTDIPKSFH